MSLRYLFEQHPLLSGTCLYGWFLYGAATTIWGEAAEREYEWRESSMFRWFLRPGWPINNPERFVASRKIFAWLALVISTVAYGAFLMAILQGYNPLVSSPPAPR